MKIFKRGSMMQEHRVTSKRGGEDSWDKQRIWHMFKSVLKCFEINVQMLINN
jgi:hypothetical protein